MALSSSGNLPSVAGADGLAGEIGNAVQVYSGGFVGIRGPDHATPGYLVPYNDEAGIMFAGGAAETTTLGDTTASPPPETRTNVGEKVLVRATVTGVTSRGDILKPVYATDDNTLTLTRPTTGEVIGIVTDWHTSTTCDVLVFAIDARAAAASTTDLMFLGTIHFGSTADGDIRTGIVAPYHGEIVEVFGMVSVALVGSGGTTVLGLEVDTANVIGGALTMSTAVGGTLGTKLSATAVTSANVIREGSAIDVEASSSGGTRTSGAIELYAKIQRRPGA